MKTKYASIFLTAAALFLTASIAQSAPVTWMLQNVTFDDGAVATGFLTIDLANSTAATDFQITVSGGSTDISGYGTLSSDPFTYTTTLTTNSGTNLSSLEEDGSSQGCFFPQSAGSCRREFIANLKTPLVDEAAIGTTIDFDLSATSFFTDFEYISFNGRNGGAKRTLVSGSVSAVPVPAAVWLFASALAGLGLRGRKRLV